MKPIFIALASVLCVSSIWAEDSEQLKNTLSQNTVRGSRESRPSAEIFQSTGGINGLIAQPNKTTPPAQNLSQVAQSAVPLPGSVEKEMASEASDKDEGKNKDKDKDKAAEKGTDKPAPDNQKETVFKEMVVTGEIEKDSHYTSPSTRVTRAQIERQNAQTTEEVLKYQPSLQIRQRYVGDPNGVLGIRGADMFSTARNMVFADGLPLHNFLQATFNGAPRWSMVGPNEIDAVDIVYGPFSAEYSGNSIGGVVNIKTRMPKKQEFYVESSLFVQPYNNYGPDKGTFVGDRQFASYGNRIKDVLTVWFSYNRLEAQSHPMSYFIDNTGLHTAPGGTAVTGGIRTPDTRGVPSIIYGDTGPEKVNTSLYKVKLGYDLTPALQAIFTGAFEERTRNGNNPANYVTSSATGQPFWGGPAPACFSVPTCATPGNASLGGDRFDVVQRGFGGNKDDRQTLNMGLTLRGALNPNWNIDTTVSSFDVLKDTRATAFFNKNDPANTGAGQLQDFKTFNWRNADLKLSTPALFGNPKWSLVTGYHWDQYNLNFKQYNLTDFDTLQRGALQANRNNSGRTSTQAFFGQSAIRFLPDWDITAGARWEWWSASNGVASSTIGTGSSAVTVSTPRPDRDLFAVSPKVSVGYEPGNWKYRYSFGRAHRFPVIAELFQSLSSPTSITEANADLKAENGTHHNFMIEYGLPRGYMRMNVFRDDIKDAIQQVLRASGPITSSSFQNIPKTSTTGIELIFNQRRVMDSKFDFMFNGTWMNAKVDNGGGIIKFTNSLGQNADYSMDGLQRIRLPHWRVNAFVTYNATENWDTSAAVRYTSDSFNDPDNKDFVNNVFGAQSDFTFVDLKTNYRHKFASGIKSRFSFGITNVNNMQAYVFHPYPQRTYLVEAAFSY